MCPIIDPSTGQPHRRPGTFLYSESGAAAIRRTDIYTDSHSFVDTDDNPIPDRVALTGPNGPYTLPIVGTLTPNGDPVTIPESGRYTFTGNFGDGITVSGPVPGHRDTGLADEQPYAITPGHRGTYNETYDRLWCQLFGPGHPDARHARRDGTN